MVPDNPLSSLIYHPLPTHNKNELKISHHKSETHFLDYAFWMCFGKWVADFISVRFCRSTCADITRRCLEWLIVKDGCAGLRLSVSLELSSLFVYNVAITKEWSFDVELFRRKTIHEFCVVLLRCGLWKQSRNDVLSESWNDNLFCNEIGFGNPIDIKSEFGFGN